jgi:hypothetical protein
MIMQPDHITGQVFAETRGQVAEKYAKDGHPSAILDQARLERFSDGVCVQIMHVGPYLEEARSLEKMAAFADARGYVFRGRHHEIYLGDPRTAKPENLKTVLRHPVVKAG